jgi:hypothetical protein
MFFGVLVGENYGHWKFNCGYISQIWYDLDTEFAKNRNSVKWSGKEGQGVLTSIDLEKMS